MKAERAGDLSILAGAALWGIFPVITILSLRALAPLVVFGWSTAVAAVFFAAVVTARGKWREVADRSALKDIVWVIFFTGILYYLLTFVGLKYTSAGNASLIALTEIFFAYALFNVWHKEHFSGSHITGAALMIIGAAIVLYPNTTHFQIGDFLIIAAAAIAPFGNFFQRRARTKVSSETIMFVRSAASGIVILVFAFLAGQAPLAALTPSGIFLLVVNGIFLMGLAKIFWIEGIHRISITKANALNSVSPLITLLVAYVVLGNVPTVWQLSSFIPISLGIILLGKNSKPETIP